jgi:hypothetical protein
MKENKKKFKTIPLPQKKRKEKKKKVFGIFDKMFFMLHCYGYTGSKPTKSCHFPKI